MTHLSQIQGKKVAVAFSSGFFGFYHHAGVLKALVESGVTPVAVSGTSAGAIVAGMYAAGMEPTEICDALLQVTRKEFWDIQLPFTRTGFGWLRGERFGAMLARLLPTHSFETCRVPLGVGVYGVKDGRSRHLTTGALIPAIRASCAVPYLFSPIDIDGTIYWDGGFAEKTPLGHLIPDETVDTVVVSHMPPREQHGDKEAKQGLFKSMKFMADTPLEERMERDKAAVQLLREAGKEVFVLSPTRVWLGPYSLGKAQEAMDHGYNEAMKILQSDDPSMLGSAELK